jgi:hypothetical protein
MLKWAPERHNRQSGQQDPLPRSNPRGQRGFFPSVHEHGSPLFGLSRAPVNGVGSTASSQPVSVNSTAMSQAGAQVSAVQRCHGFGEVVAC